MQLPEEAQPLNPWPFLAGDAALLATAGVISFQAHPNLTGLPLIVVVCCVGLGAVLAITPYLLNHTRRQELALFDRQREIAALAQITATSAEQISIVAASLHSISENAIKAAKLAEQLPHKMQEKINDFKTQLNEVAVTENESLAQEVNTLRSSDTERLETALAGVRKTAADLASIEATTRKHLTELNESLPRFSAAAEKAANDSVKMIESASASATAALKAAVTDALAKLELRLAIQAAQTVSRPPFKATSSSEPLEALPSVPTPKLEKTQSAPPISVSSPPKNLSEKIPFAEPTKTATASPLPSIEMASVSVAEKPIRKRAARNSSTIDTELMLGLEPSVNDFAQTSPEDSAPAVSADGLTRLLVTAYIGIGNKLYVRGEGPGLDWERGVPLQFVSIGKWRWESAEITAPVTLKLYKNDELECSTVGVVTLQPGHQREVTANFN